MRAKITGPYIAMTISSLMRLSGTIRLYVDIRDRGCRCMVQSGLASPHDVVSPCVRLEDGGCVKVGARGLGRERRGPRIPRMGKLGSTV